MKIIAGAFVALLSLFIGISYVFWLFSASGHNNLGSGMIGAVLFGGPVVGIGSLALPRAWWLFAAMFSAPFLFPAMFLFAGRFEIGIPALFVIACIFLIGKVSTRGSTAKKSNEN